MAGSSSLQQQQQNFSQSNTTYQCKECGLPLNSAESLEVHLQYHKENLMKHWANQSASNNSEETNNNMTKVNNIKREFNNPSNSITAPADSSDIQKKSPDYNREPEFILGHPPTPQSYQSSSSPYQNHENSSFSPNFQNFPIKSERHSPAASQQAHFQQNSFSNYQDQQFFPADSNQSQYNQEVNKSVVHQNSFRFHPYSSQPQQSQYERPKSQSQVPPSSPAYPPQPTPSPSPKQCDKCGYVCDSASLLIEHINMNHPSTPAMSAFQNNQNFLFDQQTQIKTEEETPQSEILDLDSHKVVHQVYPEEDKRQSGDSTNPHSVSAMLNSWVPQQPPSSAPSMFQDQHQNMFMSGADQKIFPNIPNNIPENKMYSADQKLFQPHQNFANNGVSSTNQDISANGLSPLAQNQQGYRPFEHLPSQPSVISSTQVPNNGGPAPTPPVGTKSANWKSNEARRPKTYNCTACNKWFTSSGHLKRHYNTTLHKNAVKSSGQPDPASMPISAHHHPTRELSNKEDRSQSGSPPEDAREDSSSMSSQYERLNPMPSLMPQPPSGPYDRQPAPNIHHTPPLHSPMSQHHSPLGNHVTTVYGTMPNGSPPNGDAGLSPNNLDSRGLLSISSPHSMPNMQHGFSMAPPHMVHQMENNQFQMYPNELAPHVTQAMAISSPSTIGEFQYNGSSSSIVEDNQPLPSFAQIQAHRYGGVITYGVANVGGGGSETAPFITPCFSEQFDMEEDKFSVSDDYKLTVLIKTEEPTLIKEEPIYSPGGNNNNNDDLSTMSMSSESEPKVLILQDVRFVTEEQQKLHIKQDYEETTGSPLITSTVPNQESKTKCFDCDKVFNRPCYLTQHNKTCHNGDKPYKCTRCGKRFPSEETYKEHSAKHAGEKPHKCEICPKQFNHKTDLRRHMCCHTGRKPYTCLTCGKGFIRKDHMVKHMETHVRKSANKANSAAMRA